MQSPPRPPADPRTPPDDPPHDPVEPGEVHEDAPPDVREAEREE